MIRALMLVGGRATRLLPLTVNTPKALVPVVNVPFLEHVIRHLVEHGIREIVLAQGHLSDPIESFLGGGSQFGVRIYYSTEPVPLGSAGAARFAERYLDDTFLVMNADVFSDLDFTGMLRLHKRRKARITIATTPVDDPSRYGVVDADADGRVRRFVEKPRREEAPTNMINAGAWFVEPGVLGMVQSGASVSFERDVFPKVLAEGQPFYSYAVNGYWIDMGTAETYLQIHRDLLTGKSRRYEAPQLALVAGSNSSVHATARVIGPVVLGSDCTIGPGVNLTGPLAIESGARIEAGASIDSCVLWRNAHVGERASVSRSILAANCRIEEDSLVEGAVLGDNVVLRAGSKVPAGTRLEPGSIFSTR
jgi:mannose-1-phosphate guanylyltransferase